MLVRYASNTVISKSDMWILFFNKRFCTSTVIEPAVHSDIPSEVLRGTICLVEEFFLHKDTYT